MKISVITATYNAVQHLPVLIDSLQKQTDKDFEWVVADGMSTDGTLKMLADIKGIDLNITIQSDFGIYDALNRGIKLSKGEFYLVMGADDYLYPDAIENFKKEVCTEVDVIAACLDIGGQVIKPGRGKPWLHGLSAFVAGHSAATLIRKKLHDKYGYYSNKFPIAADQYFLKIIFKNGVVLKKTEFVSGRFGLDGVSKLDLVGTLTEFFRVQLLTERYKFPQYIIYLLRLIKNYK